MVGSRVLSVFITLGLLISHFGYALEADSFTRRGEPLKDSLRVLDNYVSRMLEKGIKHASQAGINCKDDLNRDEGMPVVYKYIGAQALGLPTTPIERWIHVGPPSPTGDGLRSRISAMQGLSEEYARYIPLDQSIYGDLSYGETKLLGVFKMMGSTLNVNGVLIGSDKLGHFFSEGFVYFEYLSASPNGLREALEFGIYKENDSHGKTSSGIYSYADLAANFSGMQFWADLIYGKDPLIVCGEDGKYKLGLKKFTWADYVNDSWDEALNCPVMAHPAAAIKVRARLKKMGMTCPISNECEALGSLPCASYYVNPDCKEHFRSDDTCQQDRFFKRPEREPSTAALRIGPGCKKVSKTHTFFDELVTQVARPLQPREQVETH